MIATTRHYHESPTWIDLTVIADTISIHNALKNFSEFICPVVSWWSLMSIHTIED